MLSYIKNLLNADIVSRSKTIAMILPILLFIVYQGGVLFNFAIILIAAFMAFEWAQMVGYKTKWLLVGALYVSLPITSLITLRSMDYGLSFMIFLCIVIWITDIAAYFFGILIGGPKLAPKISPKKSWSGALSGLIAAMLVASVFSLFTDLATIAWVKIAALLSILGQIGDLLESYLKRRFDIKDSSNLLPGHGGFLDRTDSLIFTAPVLLIALMI